MATNGGTQKPFRVAIVGGGIGGLFATLCIHHHCKDYPIEIDVYEQASEFKEIGAGVGMGINAARLIHKIGIGEQLNNVAGKRDGVWITFRRFDNGEDIVTIPVDDTKTIRQAPVARSDLLDLYRHTIEERKAATLHTKKQCKRVEVRPSHIGAKNESSLTSWSGQRRQRDHTLLRLHDRNRRPCGCLRWHQEQHS